PRLELEALVAFRRSPIPRATQAARSDGCASHTHGVEGRVMLRGSGFGAVRQHALALAAATSVSCSATVVDTVGGPGGGDGTGAPLCQTGYDFVDGRCRMREIHFAGGTFTMGRGFCFPVEEHESEYARGGTCRFPDEPHTVTVAPFLMD